MPPRYDSFLDGHHTVEVGNKAPLGEVGHEGKARSVHPLDLAKPGLIDLYQRADIDKRSLATSPDDVAGLSENHEAVDLAFGQVQAFGSSSPAF